LRFELELSAREQIANARNFSVHLYEGLNNPLTSVRGINYFVGDGFAGAAFDGEGFAEADADGDGAAIGGVTGVP
jgi:hypothetical protein